MLWIFSALRVGFARDVRRTEPPREWIKETSEIVIGRMPSVRPSISHR